MPNLLAHDQCGWWCRRRRVHRCGRASAGEGGHAQRGERGGEACSGSRDRRLQLEVRRRRRDPWLHGSRDGAHAAQRDGDRGGVARVVDDDHGEVACGGILVRRAEQVATRRRVRSDPHPAGAQKLAEVAEGEGALGRLEDEGRVGRRPRDAPRHEARVVVLVGALILDELPIVPRRHLRVRQRGVHAARPPDPILHAGVKTTPPKPGHLRLPELLAQRFGERIGAIGPHPIGAAVVMTRHDRHRGGRRGIVQRDVGIGQVLPLHGLRQHDTCRHPIALERGRQVVLDEVVNHLAVPLLIPAAVGLVLDGDPIEGDPVARQGADVEGEVVRVVLVVGGVQHVPGHIRRGDRPHGRPDRHGWIALMDPGEERLQVAHHARPLGRVFGDAGAQHGEPNAARGRKQQVVGGVRHGGGGGIVTPPPPFGPEPVDRLPLIGPVHRHRLPERRRRDRHRQGEDEAQYGRRCT